jgi:hypothetical protein
MAGGLNTALNRPSPTYRVPPGESIYTLSRVVKVSWKPRRWWDLYEFANVGEVMRRVQGMIYSSSNIIGVEGYVIVSTKGVVPITARYITSFDL